MERTSKLSQPNPINKIPLLESWVSTNHLYTLLVITSVVGILLPILTIVLKSAPENSFLANLSWHHRQSGDYTTYYTRYALFNACVLILLLIYRSKVKAWLTKLVHWFHQNDYRFERRVIFLAGLMVIITFQTKAHLGFWHQGIAGWTYADIHPALQTNFSGTIWDHSDPNFKAISSFLKRAIVEENATYLPHAGYLTGKVMLFHYQNGEILPANYELIEFIFPQYIFDNLYQDISQQELFFQIIKATLHYRNENRRFLLPISIAYPNHTPYMSVPYPTYPAAGTLEKISFWTLIIFIDEGRQIQIVSATEDLAINAPK